MRSIFIGYRTGTEHLVLKVLTVFSISLYGINGIRVQENARQGSSVQGSAFVFTS